MQSNHGVDVPMPAVVPSMSATLARSGGWAGAGAAHRGGAHGCSAPQRGRGRRVDRGRAWWGRSKARSVHQAPDLLRCLRGDGRIRWSGRRSTMWSDDGRGPRCRQSTGSWRSSTSSPPKALYRPPISQARWICRSRRSRGWSARCRRRDCSTRRPAAPVTMSWAGRSSTSQRRGAAVRTLPSWPSLP